jgi:hypothetical protein
MLELRQWQQETTDSSAALRNDNQKNRQRPTRSSMSRAGNHSLRVLEIIL